MSSRRVSVRSGPAPATGGQYVFCGLAVAFALGTWMVVGAPTGQPLSEKYPATYSSTSGTSGSYYFDESRSYDYPNVNGPNAGRWAGKAARGLGRALR